MCERERVCVRESVCVWVGCERVCVCERERERVCVCESRNSDHIYVMRLRLGEVPSFD